MQAFKVLSEKFNTFFNVNHFPEQPESLYEPNNYFLQQTGKKIRPVMCIMGNELFDELHPDIWQVAAAIELFHNFTLVHDDIMDNAPIRRGRATIFKKYGTNTAILSGDVMLIKAYKYLSQIDTHYLPAILQTFNTCARQVCEGQQMDMDFEKLPAVGLEAYIDMITLKTSVLLAASLKMGAILGNAGERNQNNLYEFGKNLGIAFQIQDDYLDVFGEASKTGKQKGGDILSNKKTFLQIHAFDNASAEQLEQLQYYYSLTGGADEKVANVTGIFTACGSDVWTKELATGYYNKALQHLDEVVVLSSRKQALKELADMLLQREY